MNSYALDRIVEVRSSKRAHKFRLNERENYVRKQELDESIIATRYHVSSRCNLCILKLYSLVYVFKTRTQ